MLRSSDSWITRKGFPHCLQKASRYLYRADLCRSLALALWSLTQPTSTASGFATLCFPGSSDGLDRRAWGAGAASSATAPSPSHSLTSSGSPSPLSQLPKLVRGTQPGCGEGEVWGLVCSLIWKTQPSSPQQEGWRLLPGFPPRSLQYLASVSKRAWKCWALSVPANFAVSQALSIAPGPSSPLQTWLRGSTQDTCVLFRTSFPATAFCTKTPGNDCLKTMAKLFTKDYTQEVLGMGPFRVFQVLISFSVC